MNDDEYIKAKRKLDDIIVGLMEIVADMRDLNDIALSLQEILQNSWSRQNEETDTHKN